MNEDRKPDSELKDELSSQLDQLCDDVLADLDRYVELANAFALRVQESKANEDRKLKRAGEIQRNARSSMAPEAQAKLAQGLAEALTHARLEPATHLRTQAAARAVAMALKTYAEAISNSRYEHTAGLVHGQNLDAWEEKYAPKT